MTSTGSGLTVPDWPLSFGRWMPPLEGGVLYEHGHRVVATGVGLLIVIQALWLWRREPRRWVRGLGWLALAAVLLQGGLGGLTVLLRLPAAVSVSHAALAEIVFGLTVVIATALSRGWRSAEGPVVDAGEPALRTLAALVAAAVFLQIVLGAVVRHTGAGLAIPTFPLAYGRLAPPLGNLPVALHFAHRVGALVVAAVVAWTAVRVWRRHREDPWLSRPALALAGLVVLQVALGGWVVLSAKTAWIATLHLGVGALLWGTALLLALQAGRRLRLRPQPAGPEPLPLLAVR